MDFLIYDLADYVAKLKYEDIPAEVREKAKQVILDSYGNMLFGRYSDATEKILKYRELADADFSAEKKVSLLDEKPMKSSAETAVFTHTMMARCADLDDGYAHAMGHPGSGLVPLLLSAAQMFGNSGKDMITAITAAYDVYARLGEAINPFMYRERGFDATGVCGAVAAAAMYAKLQGLGFEEIKNAMGLAALFTGGLIEYQNDGTSGKIMCSGWGALTGMRAVRLAKCGFTGPNAALEGKYGFFQAFKGTSGHCDMSHVTENLGKDFLIMKIYFKRFACQRGLHSLLDGMLKLREEGGLTPSNIEHITIRTSPFVLRLNHPEPSTAVGAQASAQFTSAVALKHGRMDSEHLVFTSFSDPEIRALVAKTEMVLDEDIVAYLKDHPTHWASVRIIIKKTDGSELSTFQTLPQGDVESPFGWDMLAVKFHNFIEGTPAEEAEKARFEFLKNLEQHDSVDPLFITKGPLSC